MIGFMVGFLFVHTMTMNVAAQGSGESDSKTPTINAESALVVDFENEQILLNQNAGKVNEIASMTKMIVQYIVFEEIKNGNLSWDEEVTISEYAHQITLDPTLANVPLAEGEQYTVKELFEALSIRSANGATIALAEHIEGSEPAFVDRMRRLLNSWGIDSSQMYNSTGLNNTDLLGNHYPGSDEDAENKLSAKAVAVIAVRLLSDYPEVLDFSSVPIKTFRPGTAGATDMMNWNWMLEGLSYEREGVLGLKTGTTRASGGNFTSYAQQDGRKIISVIMNSGGLGNQGIRFEQTDRMLDYGFGSWAEQTILEEGKTPEQIELSEVYNGKQDTVELVAGENLNLLLPEQLNLNDVQVDITLHNEVTDEKGRLEAPISEGTEVGQIILTLPESIKYLRNDQKNTFGVPLLTKEGVEQLDFGERVSNWWTVFWGDVTSIFN